MTLPPLIPRDLLFGNPEIRFPRISPDGTQLAYLAPHRGVLSIWVRAADAPGDRTGDRVIAHDPERSIEWFEWQGDSRGVLYAQDRGGDENYHLFHADLTGGPARDLTPGERVKVQNVAVDARSPGEVLVMTNQRDPSAFDVHRVDLATGTSQLDTPNPGGVDAWLCDDRLVVRAVRVRRGDGGSDILVRDTAAAPWRVLDEIDSDDGAPELVALSPAGDALYAITPDSGHFMFYIQPALCHHALAPMPPIELPARDGLVLSGYLTLPVGLPPRQLPTVLYVHGGPWYRDRWGFDPDVQWLANRGYAVLQINYRGSTGYGKAFVNAGDREWAGAMRTDLLDARDWAIAQGYADPARFAIMGGSYGGYAVLTALAFTPDAFCCGVDLVGPSNLATFLQSIPPYWKTLRAMFARRMGEDPEQLAAQSPLPRAAEIRAPLLVGHGANDPRVTRHESDQLVATLRGNGIPVRYVVFDDEGHGFVRPENARRFYAAAEAFLAEHLGGRAEPAQPDEDIEPFLR